VSQRGVTSALLADLLCGTFKDDASL